MNDLTGIPEPMDAERRAELRAIIDHRQPFPIAVRHDELLALLDAADERDRFAAQVEQLRTSLKEQRGRCPCSEYGCEICDRSRAALAATEPKSVGPLLIEPGLEWEKS